MCPRARRIRFIGLFAIIPFSLKTALFVAFVRPDGTHRGPNPALKAHSRIVAADVRALYTARVPRPHEFRARKIYVRRRSVVFETR